MNTLIPLKYQPDDVLLIAKYIWICPPFFAPAFSYVNNLRIPTSDQTVWVFDDVSAQGYVNGKFYSLYNGNYQFGYISGSVNLIDGSQAFQFNSEVTGIPGSGEGQYFFDKSNSCNKNRPYFSAQTTTDAQVTFVNNEYVFTGFNHNAGAIAILPGEPFYEQLSFSTTNPVIKISVPEFINLCTQSSN